MPTPTESRFFAFRNGCGLNSNPQLKPTSKRHTNSQPALLNIDKKGDVRFFALLLSYRKDRKAVAFHSVEEIFVGSAVGSDHWSSVYHRVAWATELQVSSRVLARSN